MESGRNGGNFMEINVAAKQGMINSTRQAAIKSDRLPGVVSNWKSNMSVLFNQGCVQVEHRMETEMWIFPDSKLK